MTRTRLAGAAALLSISLAGVPGIAQVARSGSNANAQLLEQMQQLASERTALQAEAARNKKELEGLRKERDALKSAQQSVDMRARSASAALAQAVAQRDTAEQELKQAKEKMELLISKFRETIQQLRDIETDRATTQQTLATRDRELKVCLDRNGAFYELDDEVLTRLEKQTLFSRLAASEPFTRIKRVQLENLVDDYRARGDDLRLTPQRVENAARRATPSKPIAAAPAANAPPAPAPATSPPAQQAPAQRAPGSQTPAETPTPTETQTPVPHPN